MNKRATEYTLNAAQFEQLKTGYVNTIVDSMSTKDLYEYVANDMTDFVNKLTEHDLIEEVKYTLDEQFYNKFVKQIEDKITD